MANNTGYILGINGGVRPGYQDVSAVLLCKGEIVAAIEEERLTRVKHSAGQLPILAIMEVLKIAKINIHDIDLVAFHGSTWQSSIDLVLKSHFEHYFGYCPTIKRYHHHACHAASAFYASSFEQALVISVDGSGDGTSTSIAIGSKNGLQIIKEFERPQSLGIFYSIITQFCGFTRDADEYKLMGLAAYGDANRYNLDWLLRCTEDGYCFNEDYLIGILPGQPSTSRYEMLFNQQLMDKLGISRRIGSEITQEYKDLAASAQKKLEEVLCNLIGKYVRQTGIKKVCLAGGVALNCLANQKIETLETVTGLYIQPASSDAGISLGAAYLASIERGYMPQQMQHVFYGNSFSDEAIEASIKNCNVKYLKVEDVVYEAASALAQNKVIGWFQGAMEFGPRALGNRSILANAFAENIKAVVNQKVKFREGFRPFGASVLQEEFQKYFEAAIESAPYMTKVFNVKPEYQLQMQGVTHYDGTCRVQTVNEEQNELYYQLLSAVKNQTGRSVLLNTSFNLSHEPIVCTPRDAIASFFASGLDLLFIGDYCVFKN